MTSTRLNNLITLFRKNLLFWNPRYVFSGSRIGESRIIGSRVLMNSRTTGTIMSMIKVPVKAQPVYRSGVIPSHLIVLFTSIVKFLTNEIIVLALDFAHGEIVSWRKHETKLLQDLIYLNNCCKQLFMVVVLLQLLR